MLRSQTQLTETSHLVVDVSNPAQQIASLLSKINGAGISSNGNSAPVNNNRQRPRERLPERAATCRLLSSCLQRSSSSLTMETGSFVRTKIIPGSSTHPSENPLAKPTNIRLMTTLVNALTRWHVSIRSKTPMTSSACC